MARNLFVSYDLDKPGQNYEGVIAEIKTHGGWAKVHYSLFYLATDESAEQVAKAVWAQMDQNDRLLVIDAKNNDAYWYNLPADVSKHIQSNWQR